MLPKVNSLVELFSKPGIRCKNALAKAANGNYVPPTSPLAVKCCFLGGLDHLTKNLPTSARQKEKDRIINRVKDALKDLNSKYKSSDVAHWNDSTTNANFMEVLKLARV